MTAVATPSARELLLALKFNESDWVRNSGRFARYVGQGPGGGGGAGAGAGATTPKEFIALGSSAEAIDAIETMYSAGGVKARVRNLEVLPANNYYGREPALWTVVDLYDNDDIRVGMAERIFNADGSVTHHLFTLSPGRQGEGLAARLNEHAEAEYLKRGFTEIRLGADIDIGKYAWARQGYDFSNPREMNQKYHEQLYQKIRREEPHLSDLELTRRANAHIPDAIESISGFSTPLHAWEIAALDDGKQHTYVTSTGKTGTGHLGKALMLGREVYGGDLQEAPEWYGVKNLRPGSDSRAIGDAYYATKPGTEAYRKRVDRNERRRRQAAAARGRPTLAESR